MMLAAVYSLVACAGVAYAYFRLLARSRQSYLRRRESDKKEKDENLLIEMCTSWFVTVLVGEQTHELRPLDLLGFFWNNKPSTPCEACHEAFGDSRGPPIRTIRLVESICKAPKLWTIRVHNRHLVCCKGREKAIMPVSHVWNPDIARAHDEGTPSLEARLALFQKIFPLLEAVNNAYPSVDGLEVWHDYVSVPQWDYVLQQQLLLCLPSIYSAVDNIIVHLQDVKLATLSNMFLGAAGELENLRAIGVFFHSQWFRRMWPILEFASCHNAAILTQDFAVANRMGAGGTLDNSFTFMWVIGMQRFLEKAPARAATKGGLDGILMPEFGQMYMEQIRPRIRTGNTLGEVVGIIGPKECQVHRDRFIAVCALLGLGEHGEVVRQIPKDSVDACRWVMWECLKRGDYTPLLLTPTGETEVPGCSWLRTHERMVKGSWSFGQLKEAPANATIIRNGLVMPELIQVGTVERTIFLDLADAKLASFTEIALLLIEIHGMDAEKFNAGIRRLYGGPSGDSWESKPDYMRNLDQLMIKLSFSRSKTVHRQTDIGIMLCEHLGLLEQNQYKIGTFMHRYEILDKGSDYVSSGVAVIRCDGCQQRFVYHLHVFEDADAVGSRVYRIPGLHFTLADPDGLCMVISGKRIIGRSFYGTPACACRTLTLVEIE